MDKKWWLVIIVISKDLLVFIGWIILYIFDYDITVKPSLIGKFSALMQFVVVLFYFLVKVLYFLNYILPVIWLTTCAATIAAGANYVYAGMKRLNKDET